MRCKTYSRSKTEPSAVDKHSYCFLELLQKKTDVASLNGAVVKGLILFVTVVHGLIDFFALTKTI